MATATETIRLALRKLRALDVNGNPLSGQQTNALADLNGYLSAFFDSMQWRDTHIDDDYTVPNDFPAQRLIVRHSAAITITGPTEPCDGFRLAIVDASNNAATYNITLARPSSGDYLIEGADSSLTLATNNVSRIWMFRGDLGDLKRATDLALSDNLPFPSAFDYGMGLILATLIGSDSARELSQNDYNIMRGAKTRLANRYRQPLILYPGNDAAALGGNQNIGSTGIDQSVA